MSLYNNLSRTNILLKPRIAKFLIGTTNNEFSDNFEINKIGTVNLNALQKKEACHCNLSLLRRPSDQVRRACCELELRFSKGGLNSSRAKVTKLFHLSKESKPVFLKQHRAKFQFACCGFFKKSFFPLIWSKTLLQQNNVTKKVWT